MLVLPLVLGALILRIFVKESLLREGLPGYDEYSARVRYRLIWQWRVPICTTSTTLAYF
jgi:protein-S-isoprenylcysteine O-methyltransferase Ste14